MKLSDIKCRSAKPLEDKPYKLFDGGGLFLEILPSGKKLWRLKYYYFGTEKRISLGAYPLVSLSEAREERDKAKKLLLKDIDPSTVRKDRKTALSRNAQNSFKVIALEWLNHSKESWSAGYYDKMIKRLNLHVFPYIGAKPIADITPQMLLEDVLRRIEKDGSYDMAGRVRQACGQIFRYAIQTGRCEWNAAENLKGAIKTKPKEHFRTIDSKKIPAFIAALERNEARLFERTRRAVWLSLYTFCRPKEIRMARWEDIDFEGKIWIIPAAMMKMRRDHVVPLSEQVIKIFEAQRKEVEILNTQWVFPSQVRPRDPMSDGTVNKAIKNLGYGQDMVAHGFRALARTTIREKLRYDSEIIEKQLAHKTRNPLGEAYDRTQFLDERREMMQAWADYVDGLAVVGEVVKVRFRK